MTCITEPVYLTKAQAVTMNSPRLNSIQSPLFRCVYILAPLGIQTGGPEALYQLADALNQLGQPAALVPWRGTESARAVSDYAHYDAPVVEFYEDSSDTAVVIPEFIAGEVELVTRSTVFLWWLSVDNASRLRTASMGPSPSGSQDLGDFPRSDHLFHLTQSAYAWNFVRYRYGYRTTMLSDYVSVTPLQGDDTSGRDARRIAVNPAKGSAHLEWALRNLQGFDFVPLQQMDRAGVVAALRTCGAYLDLGPHPGKDRLPREASLCGCVTIVGVRGAAAHWLDVPVPAHHKVTLYGDGSSDVARVLGAFCQDRERFWDEQSYYRSIIAGEKTRFREEVGAVFAVGRIGFDVL